jgi:hypothetical protein
MNPIALGTILFGLLLLGAGATLARRGRKTAGITLALLGICLILFPIVVTNMLFR